MSPKTRVKYEAFKEETWEQLSDLIVFESSGVPVTTCNGKHSKPNLPAEATRKVRLWQTTQMLQQIIR